jgi:hypothetical protein
MKERPRICDRPIARRRWEWHSVADAFCLATLDGWRRMFLIHTLAGLTTLPADYFLALHVEVDGET